MYVKVTKTTTTTTTEKITSKTVFSGTISKHNHFTYYYTHTFNPTIVEIPFHKRTITRSKFKQCENNNKTA